jgi:hypothetical protein
MKIQCTIAGIIFMTLFSACSGPLEEYGMRGGKGQGFRLAPYQCTVPENVACRSGSITGKITRVSIEKFSEDMEPGIAFNLIDHDGNPMHVHVGPLRFMEKEESDFKVGEKVTIEGSCYHQSGKHYIIAARMSHKNHTINLRDPQGRPYWENTTAH